MSTTDISNSQVNHSLDQVRSAIIELENALISEHPKMPSLLREIHTQLKADPEVVTLLEEQEIAILVNGLEKQTTISIVTTKPKPNSKTLKKVGLDDL